MTEPFKFDKAQHMLRTFLILAFLVIAGPICAEDNNFSDQVVAPVTSAVIGFGSGHLLKGTYLERGWKFSLLDAATTFGVLGALACDQECPSLNVMLVLFAAVRTWEVLDCIDSKSSSSLSLIPAPRAQGYSLVYSYIF
jgi:hypothetical protein